ncbi:MAG: hypothetical protein M9911_08145 [Saprospiraceae bacterium]|nr:hypothetical protein [Saprospiraceae bacterium]
MSTFAFLGVSVSLRTCSNAGSSVCPSYSFRKPNAPTITPVSVFTIDALLQIHTSYGLSLRNTTYIRSSKGIDFID